MLYDEQILIDYLRTNLDTSYQVTLTDDTVGIQTKLDNGSVKIYIGHIGHAVRDVQNIWANAYSEFTNDLLLKTQVLILCRRTDIVQVWNSVNSALSVFTPFPGEGTYSCMTLLESSLQAQAAGNVFWAAHYGVIVPRIS